MLLSDFLHGLYDQTLKLGKSKYWLLFLGMVFLVVIFINGIGVVPEEPYQRLAENPFITRTDIHFNNYWQENPLLPIVAFYMGLSSPTAFNILCFVILTSAFLLFALMASRHLGSVPALIFSLLLITSPLATVMLTWIGTPDGLTVALTIPFLFSHSSLFLFLLAILGAANHPAFMFAVIEILVLRWAARNEITFKHVFTTCVGIAAGYGLVRLFLTVNQIDVVTREEFMLFSDMGDWLKMNALNLPMSVTSLFNIQWLILPICLVMFFKKDRLFYSIVLTLLLGNFTITFFTLDTTRIFSLLSWGVLFECMFHSLRLARAGDLSASEAQEQFLQSLILVSMASLIAPRYFSWAGEIHTTPFYQFMRKVFR